MAKSIQISRRYVDNDDQLLSYRLYVEAINAQEMSSKVFIKQRIVNFSKGTTDDVFVGVCTPAQLENLGEDSPLAGTSFFRSNSVDLIATTAEELKDVLDSLVYEVKKLVDDLAALDVLGDDEIYNIFPNQAILILANSPKISNIQEIGNALFVYFDAPNNVLPIDVDNYQYSLNNGTSWSSSYPAINQSPLTINNIDFNTEYFIKIRAVTKGLVGKTSTTVNYTTGAGIVGTKFKGTVNSVWTNIDNWTDASDTPANTLPLASSVVTLLHDCTVDTDSPLWVAPLSISIGGNNLTFNSTAQPHPVITCDITATTGVVTFNGVDYGI